MTDTQRPGPDRRTLIRGAALTTGLAALGSALNVVGATGAAAQTTSDAVQAAAPELYWRGAWGARPPSSPSQVINRAPSYIVVHHTASANSTDYSLEHAFQLSRNIQSWHMDGNGWSDTGQQLTISRGGHLMVGRDQSPQAIAAGNHVVGAHVANHNSEAIGIENEGTYTSADPTAALTDTLVDTLAWLCGAYGLNPSAIVGHRDFNATECPGERLYAMLPELRNRVTQTMQAYDIPISPFREPDEGRPTYPAVPDTEIQQLYYHGPALGEDDITR